MQHFPAKWSESLYIKMSQLQFVELEELIWINFYSCQMQKSTVKKKEN